MMGIAVIRTILMMLLFGNFTPSLDVWSDIQLSIDTLTFNLGKSLELSGCRLCHSIPPKQNNDLEESPTQTCISSPQFRKQHPSTGCFRFTFTIEKIIEIQESSKNEAWVFENNNDTVGHQGGCSDRDFCCIEKISSTKVSSIYKSKPRVTTYECKQLDEYCMLCFQANAVSIMHCDLLWNDLKSKTREPMRKIMHTAAQNRCNKTFFEINEDGITETSNFIDYSEKTIEHDDFQCGLFLAPVDHETLSNNKICSKNHCEEYVIGLGNDFLTKSLGINDWKSLMEYDKYNRRIGGKICELLTFYGRALIVPVLLNMMFHINAFCFEMRNGNASLFEFVFVLLLFYPQYRCSKIIFNYFYHKDESKLLSEKATYEKNIESIESYVESGLQVHISLSIVFATQSFYPSDPYGLSESDISPFPLLAFILSMISASFGITKFQLSGPLPTLPKNSALSGIASIQFLFTFLLNTMFGVRVFMLESALFSTYRMTKPPIHYNSQFDDHWMAFANGSFTSVISPVISPEYRLLVFFLPGLLSVLVNLIHLASTLKKNKMVLVQFPQFILTPAYSPFMYEGASTNNAKNEYTVRIWKTGSIVNAIFIGIFPPILLMLTDIQRGVTSWKFVTTDTKNSVFTFTDAILKFENGNLIFSIVSLVVSLLMILLFFFNDKLFSKKGIYCRICNIICCPCPKPCVKYDPEFISNYIPEHITCTNTTTNFANEIGKRQRMSNVYDDGRTKTLIFSYTKGGEDKSWLAGKPMTNDKKSTIEAIQSWAEVVDETPDMPQEHEFRRCSIMQNDVFLHDSTLPNVNNDKDIAVTNEHLSEEDKHVELMQENEQQMSEERKMSEVGKNQTT